MKAEFINPFIQGAENTLAAVCGETTSLGKVYLKEPPFQGPYNIEIEIVGELTGHVYYSMESASACGIASKMMMGMPIPALDDMSKSALCELANMISGSVATLFSQVGKSIDIRPPKFSEDFSSIVSPKLLCVPINLTDNKTIEINIWIND